MTRLVCGLAVLWMLALAPAEVAGQATGLALGARSAAPSDAEVTPPSPNDVRELMRLLGDERMVAWLRQQAEADGATAAEADAGPGIQEQVRAALGRAHTRLVELTSAWAALPQLPLAVAEGVGREVSTGEALRSAIYVITFLFVGFGLEWLYWRYVGGALRRIELASPTTLGRTFSRAGARALLLGGGVVLFALGSVGTFLGFAWPPMVERWVLNLLLAVVTLRVVSTLTVFVLAPRVDELRLLPLDRPRARLWFLWIMALAAIGVVGFLAVDTLEDFEVAPTAIVAVDALIGAVFALTLILAIWRLNATRQGTRTRTRTRTRRGRDPAAGRTRLGPGHLAPVLGTALVLAAYGLWLVGAHAWMGTVLIVAALVPASALARAMVDHLFDRAEAEPAPAGAAEPTNLVEAHELAPQDTSTHRYDTYRPIVHRLARFVLVAAAVVGLSLVWGVDVLSLSTSATLAGRAFGVALDIVVALLIADLVWVWAKTAIDRRLATFGAPEPGHAPGPEARMATLLPLFRKILLVTVIIMVALIALSSLGINIGPLLAGAGVVGIAIGFGAQALVRDIVSGVFFLIDDAFRVGEYIEMGELRGTVESISIRSLRVRHHRGAVHTIPFGELKSLTNYSRDWVVMKLEFRVPFHTDVDLVKKIVKKIGQELQENPDYGPHIIETLKSQGVRRMEEFNMVIGVKFTAKPGEQWTIRRDAYQRIRDAFKAHGITFAERNVRVEVVGDERPSEAVRKAAIGAAQDAIEQQAGVAG